MTGKTVAILGGGWGGLTAANALRMALPREHRVLLVSKSPTFSLAFSNLWVMTGERAHPREGERTISGLSERGIEVMIDEVETIDIGAKRVRTGSAELAYDYLVVALGADYAPQAVPGFAEAAYNFFDPQGALRLQGALAELDGGRVVVLITRMPFKCPAAPYEAAFMVDALLRAKDVREKTEMAVYTPEPQPMPVAGRAVGDALEEMLREREIAYHIKRTVQRIDAERRQLIFGDGEAPVPFDLLLGVPPHTAPKAASSLAGPNGWIPVDPATLATQHDGVYAIGDITAIPLKNGMLLPKAGVFAAGEAEVVARNIALQVQGKTRTEQFDGNGFCWIEAGEQLAGYGEGNFYAEPAPAIHLRQPSYEFFVQKRQWERKVLASVL